jgi:hypothetical protein
VGGKPLHPVMVILMKILDFQKLKCEPINYFASIFAVSLCTLLHSWFLWQKPAKN